MNKYPSVLIITTFAFCCITAGALIMYFGEKYDNRFSPPRVPVPAALVGPGRIIISTMDLQRELNRRGYKLKVDGDCGPATQAAWDAECGNQYAIELMIKEPTP